ncbi:MAG: hypothetical protein HY403_06335 [Elusimicrobia bacterium]|nr:hypothetical protein [Elusimicrobiota bacterium]
MLKRLFRENAMKSLGLIVALVISFGTLALSGCSGCGQPQPDKPASSK